MKRAKDGSVRGMADVVVANVQESKALAVVTIKDYGKPPWPVYCDEEITSESKLQVVEINTANADYYRDLFVHKLGSTSAGVHKCYAALVDGRVFGVMGLNMDKVHAGTLERVDRMTQGAFKMVRSIHAPEVLGVVKTPEKETRLKRLLVMATSCGDCAAMIRKSENVNVIGCGGIRTTTFTNGPTEQARRGISYEIEREEVSAGYRLVYRTDFRDDTYDEVLARWLSEQERAKGQKKNGRKRTQSRSRS